MTDDEYIAKLTKIRDEWLKRHRKAVDDFPGGNPGQGMQAILTTYETYEALDRIMKAQDTAATPYKRPIAPKG